MTAIQMVILALLVESVWQTGKMVWQNGKISIDKVGSVVVGLVVAFLTNADIIQLLGFEETIPYVGIVLTGLLISNGAGYMHDLFKKATALEG